MNTTVENSTITRITPENLAALSKEDLIKMVMNLNYDSLYYKEELERLKRLIFGSKSERFISNTGDGIKQLSLFEGKEQLNSQEKVEEVSYTRKKAEPKKKKKSVRLAIPEHLPREVIQLEPEEDVSGMVYIGDDITEILEYNPGRIYVKKFVRPKYKDKDTDIIISAELPSLPIPKGNAGPGLIAHIIVNKYFDHLPVYRQAKRFSREGLTIAETTIHGWIAAGCKLINPLQEQLKQMILQTDYLMADETPIPVLTSNKKHATHRGYFWVYYSPLTKMVYFDYQEGRGREGPVNFLKEFKGDLQSDGYIVYDYFDNIPSINLLACMAHVRRKFDQAKDNDPSRASYALSLIQKLYEIERAARENNMSFEQRYQLRQKEALPKMKIFESWLKENANEVLPQNSIGKAIGYALNQWDRLIRYLDDGRYEIDNNLIENSIRPVALGRKNFLFAGSHQGAQRAAMIYSLLGTCKINNIEPYSWLSNILDRLPEHKANRLEELLPQNWNPLKK